MKFKKSISLLLICVMMCCFTGPLYAADKVSLDIADLLKSTGGWQSVNTGGNEFSEGELTAASAAVQAGYTKAVNYNDISFNFNTELPTGVWSSISLRSNIVGPVWGITKGYTIMFHNTQTELIKGTSSGMKSMAIKALSYADGKEHTANVEFMDSGETVNIIVTIDGETVFDIMDEQGYATDGLLSFMVGGADAFIQVRGKREPQELPPREERPKADTQPDEHEEIGNPTDISDLFVKVDDWKYSGTGTLSTGKKITQNYGASACGYMKPIDSDSFVFKSRSELKPGSWTTIAFRVSGIWPAVLWNTTSYAIMQQQGNVSLTKVSAGTLTEVGAWKGDLYSDGEWHTWKIDFHNVEDKAVDIVVFLDGEQIINCRDSSNPFFADGGINIDVNGAMMELEGIREINDDELKNVTPPGEVMLVSGKGTGGGVHVSWRYDPRESGTINGVSVYNKATGELLGRATLPARNIDITGLKDETDYELIVKSIKIGGVESEGTEISVNTAKVTEPEFEQIPYIRVKEQKPCATFEYSDTGEEFLPNGFNWCRLYPDHASFEPGIYDHDESEYICKLVKEKGFNVLRVFICGRYAVPEGVAGPRDTIGLDKEYLDNFVDLLKVATKYGVYIYPCIAAMPNNDYFKNIIGEDVVQNGKTVISGENKYVLAKGGVEAKKEYMRRFLQHIIDADARLLNTMFGVQIENETTYYASSAPFNLSEGTVTAANGKTYDMSDRISVEAMKRDGYIYRTNEVASVVREMAPNLMVGDSAFFEDYWGYYLGVSKRGFETMSECDLDFLDLHNYPALMTYASLEKENYAILESCGLFDLGDKREKLPLIFSEYGLGVTEDMIEIAADTFKNFLDITYRMGVRGWMHWTLDTVEQDGNWAHGIYNNWYILDKLGFYNGPVSDEKPVETLGNFNWQTVYSDSFDEYAEEADINGTEPETSTLGNKWNSTGFIVHNSRLASTENDALAMLRLPELNKNSIVKISLDMRPYAKSSNWLGFGFLYESNPFWVNDDTGSATWSYVVGPEYTTSIWFGTGTANLIFQNFNVADFYPGMPIHLEIAYNFKTDEVSYIVNDTLFYHNKSTTPLDPAKIKYAGIQALAQNTYKDENDGWFDNVKVDVAQVD